MFDDPKFEVVIVKNNKEFILTKDYTIEDAKESKEQFLFNIDYNKKINCFIRKTKEQKEFERGFD